MEQENSNSTITFTDFEGTVVSVSEQRSSGWCNVLLNTMPEGVTRISGIFPQGIEPFNSHVKGLGIIVDKGKYGRQMEIDPMTVKLSVSSEAPVPFEGHVVAVSWQDMRLLEGYDVTPEALQELAATGRMHFVGLTSYRPSTPESPVPPALRIIKTNCFLVNVDGKVQVENARRKGYGGIKEYFSENQTSRCASTSKKKEPKPAPETHTHKLK